MVTETGKKSGKPPLPPATFAAPPSRARAKRILVRVIWAMVILLVLVRIALPFIVRAAVERSLSGALGTGVEIHDVDLSLLRGAIWIQGLRIQGPDGFKTPEPIQIVELGINAKVWSLLGKTLTIQHISVKDPLVVLERNDQGEIGVIHLVEQMAEKKAEGQQPTGSRPAALRINSIRVENGGVVFLDHQAGEQPLSTGIYELNARVREVRPATPDSQMPTSFELTARLLEKPGAGVTVKGKGDFFSSGLSLEAELELERVGLAHFSPYYADTPLEIRRGFVSADAHAVCHNDMLDMPIQITFSDMDVGVRSGMAVREAFGVPARLVVAFFTSPEGTTPITAHVSGNVRDPQFHLERTVSRAVSQAMQSKILQLRDAGKLAIDTDKEIIENILEADIVAAQLMDGARKARIQATKAQMGNLKTALGLYEMVIGSYPTTAQGLKALVERPPDVSEELWDGAFLESEAGLKDAWKREFIYVCPGEHNKDSYDLYSKGYDGEDNTEDDITNWEVEEEVF